MPGLYRNVLLVGKVADLGHVILFDKTSCVVITKDKPFRVIAQGKLTLGSGLYKLTQLSRNLDHTSQQVHSLDNISGSQNPQCLTSSAKSLSRLWHLQLGHTNYSNLSLLTSHNLATCIPKFKVVHHTCTTCHEEK